ncbi:glycoside hydrolase family 13 protein [Flavobacterium algicola]|uniref:glycoside hydrolase family 13 protein n=1 Tax=Flavobacterium algicola TaxID=556529 RepID=UPI001EFDC549|nr:glycoside hydrolase family 13 protein [Flavobacterium algicola]MCG9791849.1 glycoside hydrolase family 13 protein [Flavobacterium algicola]
MLNTLKNNILLLLVTGLSWSSYAQIQRMEPPYWYTGMNNTKLQIVFYGSNIAQNEVSAPAAVPILAVTKTENPNYLFVTIDTKDLLPQELVFSFSKNKKKHFTTKYELKKRRENSALRESYSAADMMYLVMPDRFANGNPQNDNEKSMTEKTNTKVENGRHGGDLEGIIQHLDYIQELGATTVWCTPLCVNNNARGSYHGYGQSDVYQIDPRFGTNADYLRLSNELHKKDMKLVMDYVTNHWGAQHWMIKDLPTYNWIHQFPGYAQTNYRMTTQFDPNASKIDARLCADGWFVQSMPDLNQSNELVLNYLTQNAIWWIESANLDGFRVDTYSYNDKRAIAKWTKAITNEYPNFNIVGEVWMQDQAQMAYWQKDSKIAAIQNYNSYLPSVMDFTFMDATAKVFDENEASWNNGLIKLYENFANDFLYPNPNNLLTFVENHDTQRFNEIYKKDFKKYAMAMSVLATVRGIPQLYYGSEIGMAGDKSKGDGAIRQDFPGGWQGDTNNAFTKEGRTVEQQQFFDFSSKLFRWRKTNEAVHFGKTTHYLPIDNVYVYFRYTTEKTVMVIVNNNLISKKIKTDRFAENILNYTTGKEVLTEIVVPLKNEITIEPQTALLFELQK